MSTEAVAAIHPEDYADLWPFDEDATCTACGSKEVRAMFKPEAHDYGCREHRPRRADACCSFQHIHRHCQRCHKEWIEAPLDVTESVRGMQRMLALALEADPNEWYRCPSCGGIFPMNTAHDCDWSNGPLGRR